MKKTALALSLCLLLAAVGWASAAGGSGDPLASLSYLTGTFTEKADREIDKKLDDSDRRALAGGGSTSSVQAAAGWTKYLSSTSSLA